MHQTPDTSFLARRGLGIDDVVLVRETAGVLGFGVDTVDLSFSDTSVDDCLA